MRFKLLLALLFSVIAVQAARGAKSSIWRPEGDCSDTIHRLYVPSPFGAYMMYALAPDLMTGLVFSPTESDKKYLPEHLQHLPVLGVLTPGMGMTANLEMILKCHPDVLVIWNLDRSPMDDRITSALDKLNIPYVIVVGNSMYEYPAAIRFLGRLTGRTQRAKLLAKTSEGILSHVSAMVSKVPPGQRPGFTMPKARMA